MDNGFIVLHRKLLDNPIVSDEGLFQLFIVLLLMAGYEDKRAIWNGQEITLKRGQFITGRFSLAEKLHVKPTTVYYRLNTLKKLGIIDIKSNNKFSVITIVKYSQYQDIRERPNNKTDNKPTTNRQQTDTTNNINKDNNITINTGSGATPPTKSVTVKDDLFENLENQEKVIAWLVAKGMDEGFAKLELAKFISYWTERDSKGKMRYESQKFFEVRKRLATWFSRANGNFNNKPPTGRTRKVIKL